MTKAAIVILAGVESQADKGRVVNGLQTAKEFSATQGDEVKLVFDGAGTQWIPELEDRNHEYHDLYQSVRDDIAVCDYCTDAFGVGDAVDEADLPRLDDHEGHPSIRSLVADDFEIITF